LRSSISRRWTPGARFRAHIEAEATKLAYATRDRIIADPDHVTGLQEMLDPATGKALAAQIDPGRAMPCPPHPTENRHKETVYLTVVDKDRMAVSIIYSIFKDFGSGVASDRFGILFHNRGAGFRLDEGHPNEAMGGKRPMHTIIPAMLKRKRQDHRCRSASWGGSTSPRVIPGWSPTSSISA
jgi:gamma-glutamyltranspeptidase/glutathione hydrolase